MDKKIVEYLRKIGRKGGQRSRRTLTAEAARAMVRVREARRAFKRFRTSCFWSADPKIIIKESDIPWVIENLRRNGDRAAWMAAQALEPHSTTEGNAAN